MSMKRAVGAAAFAASVGISALMMDVGPANGAPPSCPGDATCQPGPGGPGGGGGGAPAAAADRAGRTAMGARQRPGSTQSSSPPTTQSTEAPVTTYRGAGDNDRGAGDDDRGAGDDDRGAGDDDRGAPDDNQHGAVDDHHNEYDEHVADEHNEYDEHVADEHNEYDEHNQHNQLDEHNQLDQHLADDHNNHVDEACSEHPAPAPALLPAGGLHSGQCASGRPRGPASRLRHCGPGCTAAAAAAGRVLLERRPTARRPATELVRPAASGWVERSAASRRLEPPVGRSASRFVVARVDFGPFAFATYTVIPTFNFFYGGWGYWYFGVWVPLY